MKTILPLFFAALIITSCESSSANISTSDSTTSSTDSLSAKPSNNPLLIEKGIFSSANGLSDDGVEIYLESGAYFMAWEETKIELEGLASIQDLEGGEHLEITYTLSEKEENTQLSSVEGAEKMVTKFLTSVDGNKQTQQLSLISYELIVDGNESSCTLKGKNKKGEVVEYKSSLNDMDREGVFSNNYALSPEAITIIEKSGFYKKEDNWETEEDYDTGLTKLTLLDEKSDMVTVNINSINYQLKEMQKIRVIK